MTDNHYMKDNDAKDIHVLLNDIRSAHNVGSMFRTADAIGVSTILLSGYTPCPLDRFGRPVAEIAKTALGSEITLSWSYEKDPLIVIAYHKREGYTIVGLEQDERAVDYKQFPTTDKILFLVGSEVAGLTLEMRENCDVLIEIPMHGKKESLNVAVAFGIALFRLFDN